MSIRDSPASLADNDTMDASSHLKELSTLSEICSAGILLWECRTWLFFVGSLRASGQLKMKKTLLMEPSVGVYCETISLRGFKVRCWILHF